MGGGGGRTSVLSAVRGFQQSSLRKVRHRPSVVRQERRNKLGQGPVGLGACVSVSVCLCVCVSVCRCVCVLSAVPPLFVSSSLLVSRPLARQTCMLMNNPTSPRDCVCVGAAVDTALARIRLHTTLVL